MTPLIKFRSWRSIERNLVRVRRSFIGKPSSLSLSLRVVKGRNNLPHFQASERAREGETGRFGFMPIAKCANKIPLGRGKRPRRGCSIWSAKSTWRLSADVSKNVSSGLFPRSTLAGTELGPHRASTAGLLNEYLPWLPKRA